MFYQNGVHDRLSYTCESLYGTSFLTAGHPVFWGRSLRSSSVSENPVPRSFFAREPHEDACYAGCWGPWPAVSHITTGILFYFYFWAYGFSKIASQPEKALLVRLALWIGFVVTIYVINKKTDCNRFYTFLKVFVFYPLIFLPVIFSVLFRCWLLRYALFGDNLNTVNELNERAGEQSNAVMSDGTTQ